MVKRGFAPLKLPLICAFDGLFPNKYITTCLLYRFFSRNCHVIAELGFSS